MKISIIRITSIFLFLVTNAFTQAPLLLNYQGKLFDQNSEPLNANTDITFKIFTAETEGTELWSETHTNVTVSNGIFNVMLGSVTTLSADVFTDAGSRYLEVVVDTETLSPRFHLVSVAYAIRATEADGVGDGSIDTQQLRDGAVTQIKLDEGITAIPAGSAGGDLAGDFPNPTVNGILGREISSTTPTTGQVLKYNDVQSQWEPANDISGGDGTVSTAARLTGDGSATTPLDIAQQGASEDQVLQWIGGAWVPGTISVTGGNTLDQAYDQGGAGAGRTITADNGAVNIAGTDGLTVSGTISATTFSGSGASLTSLNATNLSSGTVPDARLDADLNDLADGSLTGSKVGTGINASYITSGTVASSLLDTDLQDLADGSLTGSAVGTGINANNVTTGTISDARLEATLNRTVITASDRMGIGTTTPFDAYSLHIISNDNAIGNHVDFNQTTNNTTNYGVSVDLDNTYTGNSNNYGFYSNVYKAGGSYSSFGFYGQVTGSSTHTGPKMGVYGRAENDDNTGSTYGVYGNASGDGTGYKYGVYGFAGGNGTVYGVFGSITSTDQYSQAIRGQSSGGSIWGFLGGSDRGFEAGNGSNWGLIGSATQAAYFSGNVQIVGTLSKSAGSFKIDHPLDPANKYLYHSFVESPDMKNIYDGVVTLDNNGEATIDLPDWFEVLNKDFRYQLTAIGAPGPNLYIAQEIMNNQFKIAGGTSIMKVSWHVTGIRDDAYARAHRIKVEEDKTGEERGNYLNPQVFGLPAERSVMKYQREETTEERID